MKNFRLEVFKKAALCRNFENELYKKVQEKIIKFPVYLSAGQEFIASTIAEKMNDMNVTPDIFIQHRGHSTYLAFGGDLSQLIDEMLGKKQDALLVWVARHLFSAKIKIYMDMMD